MKAPTTLDEFYRTFPTERPAPSEDWSFQGLE
jgi:hypothetical protein